MKDGKKTMVKAVRGAIQLEADTPEDIHQATCTLFDVMLKRNKIESEQIISLIISQTDDLHSYNPATALRQHGVDGFALFCLQELKIDRQLPRTIRFLMHITCEEGKSLDYVYLGGAKNLRPDLC